MRLNQLGDIWMVPEPSADMSRTTISPLIVSRNYSELLRQLYDWSIICRDRNDSRQILQMSEWLGEQDLPVLFKDACRVLLLTYTDQMPEDVLVNRLELLLREKSLAEIPDLTGLLLWRLSQANSNAESGRHLEMALDATRGLYFRSLILLDQTVFFTSERKFARAQACLRNSFKAQEQCGEPAVEWEVEYHLDRCILYFALQKISKSKAACISSICAAAKSQNGQRLVDTLGEASDFYLQTQNASVAFALAHTAGEFARRGNLAPPTSPLIATGLDAQQIGTGLSVIAGMLISVALDLQALAFLDAALDYVAVDNTDQRAWIFQAAIGITDKLGELELQQALLRRHGYWQ